MIKVYFCRLMQLLKNIGIVFWRIWFYLIMVLTVLPISPLLLFLTASDKTFNYFFKIAHYWGKSILFLMGFKLKVEGKENLKKHTNYMFTPNHTSMIDIMTMLAIAKHHPFVFVGKIELAKIPIFGFFYRRTMILVDRNNKESRKAVFDQANQRLKKGLSICIFPEGMVPADQSIILNEFKSGAFVLALEHQIPIIPISFYDNKKHFSYTFLSGGPGVLNAKIHKSIPTKNLSVIEDRKKLQKQVYEILYHDLNENMSN